MTQAMTVPLSHPAVAPRTSGLRIATPAPRVAVARRTVPEPTPDQYRAQARDIARQACQLGRLDAIVAVAREALQLPGGLGAEISMWQELSELTPAPQQEPGASATTLVEEDSLWLLRRTDGTLIELLRLRGNGLVGLTPDPCRASWRATADGVVLSSLAGEVSSRFSLRAQQAGRPVLLGCAAGPNGQPGEMQVLTEVDCAYSRLRMVDPELTNPMAGLFRSDELINADLPEVPVVLLAAARTGSNLLLNLLNSSDRVFLDGEIFNPDKISLFGADLPADRKDGLDMMRMSDPVRFARILMSRSHHVDGRRIDRMPARGFKLFPEQARPVFDWALDTPQVRVLHLYRANLLAEFSSYLTAMRDQAWVGGAQSPRRPQLLFDPERFMRFVDMKQRYLVALRERLAARAGAWTEIEYSDISARQVDRVLTELTGAPSARPLSTLGLRRQLSSRVLDRFANPYAVQRCLDAIGRPEWAGVEPVDVAGL